MQSHQTAIAFKKTSNSNWANIKLIAENQESKVSTQIAYNEHMTRGLDVSYDAGYFNSHPNFALYTKLVDDNGEKFALQCLPASYEDLIVPIGLEVEAGTSLTFKVELSNLPEDYVAVLEDRLLGTMTSLENENDFYNITLENGNTGTGRFYLHTGYKSTLGSDELSQSAFHVYANASSSLLLINGNVDENTKASVYDIQGKLVKTFELQRGTQNSLKFNEQSGVYIIQISNSKGVLNEKVNWVK